MNYECKISVKVGIILFLCVSSTLALKPELLLTPLLQKHNSEELRNFSAVDPSLFLNVTSYSGFLTVDERYDSNTFFWYFPAENKPMNETPWIVWLQGGPGASSLVGVFSEMGPFEYDIEEMIIKLRKWSWTKDYSMLFIDNPVGAGYSFTNSTDGYVRDMYTCASHLYIALRQFLVIFPELRRTPLFIAGESYAGRYLPALGLKILDQDEALGELDVNLQGIIMGNPMLSLESIADYSSVFEHWGLIDTQGALAVKPLQDQYTRAIKNRDARAAYNLRNQLLARLNALSYQPQMYNALENDLQCQLKAFKSYTEKAHIREAMHVGLSYFEFSNQTVQEMLIPDFLNDVSSKVIKLLERRRILIYCGHLDLTVSCMQSARSRRTWQWSGRDLFLNAPRTPWWYEYNVAGHVKSGGNLTEVSLRGAGHLAAMDQPGALQYLVSHFIQSLELQVLPYEPSPDDTPRLVTDSVTSSELYGHNTVTAVSITLNVILVLVIIVGVMYTLRWKKKAEAYFYRTVDDSFMAN